MRIHLRSERHESWSVCGHVNSNSVAGLTMTRAIVDCGHCLRWMQAHPRRRWWRRRR